MAATCRALFESQPEGAPGWVQAAVTSPSFVHPMVTGPNMPVPTGGTRSTALANYAMVLQYLASHRAWEHFATVLVRGVAVSEAEDQDVDEEDV